MDRTTRRALVAFVLIAAGVAVLAWAQGWMWASGYAAGMAVAVLIDTLTE